MPCSHGRLGARSEAWHAWEIVHAWWLGGEGRLADKGHGSAAVGRLRGHGVRADHHRDRADVEQDEANPADDLHNDQRDLAFRLELHVSILVELRMSSLALHDQSPNRNQQDHEELEQDRPGGHVHAILSPALGCPLLVGELQSTHACANEQDREHGAEGNGALGVLHHVCEEVPLEASELLHRDANPQDNEDDEELHGEVDYALHGHRDRRGVLWALGVLNREDGIDHASEAHVDADREQKRMMVMTMPGTM